MSHITFYVPQARSDVDANSDLFTPHVLEVNHEMCTYPEDLWALVMRASRTPLPDGFEVVDPSGIAFSYSHNRDDIALFTVTADSLAEVMSSHNLGNPIYQAIMAFLRELPPDYPVIPVAFL